MDLKFSWIFSLLIKNLKIAFMKKSLLAFPIGLSVFTLSCQKNSIQSKEIQGDPVKSSERSPIDVGGSNGGVTFQCTSCTMTYPDNSNLPRSAADFNESDVLVAAEPGQTTCGIDPQYIKVWYSDEHALTLGVREVNIITSSSGGSTGPGGPGPKGPAPKGGGSTTTTTDYPFTFAPAKYAAVAVDPQC